MNLRGKKAFVRSLCRAVAEDIVVKLDRVPEDWNGWELRELVVRMFEREAMYTRRMPVYRSLRKRVTSVVIKCQL
jgi:hypothetical protein